jgi:hypothetical protein
MFKNLDRTPFAYSLYCFKIDLLKLEVMRMLSKHHFIQRDQLEMITLDQLVPANHWVRKLEAYIGIRSMRKTIEDAETNMAYRWFLGYGLKYLISQRSGKIMSDALKVQTSLNIFSIAS